MPRHAKQSNISATRY